MKYRLKKDTPEFKAGSVFTRRKYDYGDYDDDFLFADISPGTSPVPAFDISLIDDFDEWFEKVDESSDWLHNGTIYYRPEVGVYDKRFLPCSDVFRGTEYDMARRRIGFCHKSAKSCERFIAFLEAVEVVSHDDGFMCKSSGGFGWPVIEYTTNNPGVDDIAGRQHAGEFYFDTREHALDSAMNHTREWQTILNYDWSRE